MIGDWVLRDGMPYRWEMADYNRSALGMEEIKPMPLTEDILEKNDYKRTEGYGIVRMKKVVHLGKPNCRTGQRTLNVSFVDIANGSVLITCRVYGAKSSISKNITSVSELQHILIESGHYAEADGFIINKTQ